MANSTLSLTSLAESVSQLATALSAKLEEGGFPAPSFNENGLADYPKLPEVVVLRLQLLDAVSDLYRLATGPNDSAFLGPLFLNYDASVLDILNQFNFWDSVPLGGSATYSEIAAKVNLPENVVRRIVRYAITIRYFDFAPGSKDTIVHTSLSAAPAKQQLLRTWIRHSLEEARPGASHLAEALWKYSAGKEEPSQEAIESAFSLANIDRLSEPETFWEYLEREIEGKPRNWRSTKFAETMQAAAAASAIKTADLLKIGYDWGKAGEATVVGGSSGHDAVILAREFPNLKFIVQDLPGVQQSFDDQVPQDLKSRISYIPRDFFTAQETRADIYVLKSILHDWSDKYAAQILSTLVPQLEGGGRILLVESVTPADSTELPWVLPAHVVFAADLHMMTTFSSLERSLGDWKALLAKVDKRLEITYVSNVPGAAQNFIEIKLSS
ncbi:hypothetical protein S40285_04070 [Stachybotrys chlorohalonatus IBT 40285]|uniref:O-methyltransferase C-terminal domain-containing protein n=1 Tax=Stachybotrys chlorohalonatus (strain IBT 40285) TaxID=1283841 RepID=A0A084R0A2_STAC4|nr:hypothetical protein S40285_04070 [Stachybotrys chlorohalonata IBT 40285]